MLNNEQWKKLIHIGFVISFVWLSCMETLQNSYVAKQSHALKNNENFSIFLFFVFRTHKLESLISQ